MDDSFVLLASLINAVRYVSDTLAAGLQVVLDQLKRQHNTMMYYKESIDRNYEQERQAHDATRKEYTVMREEKENAWAKYDKLLIDYHNIERQLSNMELNIPEDDPYWKVYLFPNKKNKIECMKMVRAVENIMLKDAKERVEASTNNLYDGIGLFPNPLTTKQMLNVVYFCNKDDSWFDNVCIERDIYPNNMYDEDTVFIGSHLPVFEPIDMENNNDGK